MKSIQNDIKKLNEEHSLCCCSRQPTQSLSLELLPSKEEIIKFKGYLDELELKKFEREEEFLNIKPQILELVDELKYKLCVDFERMVVSPDDSMFVVSADNMASLSNFMKSLKQLSVEIKEKILYLREKLESLWDQLNKNLHKLMDKNLQNYGTMSSDAADVRFEGPSNATEFNSLCDNIVTNIYTINSSWKTLENALKSLGTTRDNQGLRDKIHVTQLSTNQIITVTPKDLNRLKMIVKKGDKQKDFQVSKLTENFTEAMAKYHSMQKLVASKMKAHLLVVSTPDQSSFEDVNTQQQIQLSRELAFEQDLLLDRESRIQQIESDILDVNQIMRELSVLVHEQGETVDTIENSIERATGHVEEGTEELLKASRYQSRYRKKLWILAILAIIVISVLIGILVPTLKKK
ncbi:hypothetical protein FQA39_LY00504 [Lamprigera yunnana]|nr:hypothetical protein FQA39_LY00504 [Lamprigera yunnana]